MNENNQSKKLSKGTKPENVDMDVLANAYETMNDAATLLLQIDGEDYSEIGRLLEYMDAVSGDPGMPDAIKNISGRASEILGDLLSGEVRENDAVLSEVGGLIESALNVIHEKQEIEGEADFKAEREAPEATTVPDVPSVKEVADTSHLPPEPEEKTEESEKEEEATEPVEQVVESLSPDLDLDLVGAFIVESGDLISCAEDALLALEVDPDDMDAIGVVFRAFHTIKGTSAFLELKHISEAAHLAESFLSRVREGEIRFTGGYADLALKSVDMIKALMLSIQGYIEGDSYCLPKGYQELLSDLRHPEGRGIIPEGHAQPAREIEKPHEKEAVTEEAGETGPSEPEYVPAEDAFHAASEPEEETADKETEKKSPAGEPAGQQTMETSRQMVDTSVRVPVDRLDRFVDMVGELVVAHSMVSQDETVAGGQNHELSKKVAQTGKIVRELQHMSMSMRMVPLRATFRKMARLVRDLARRIGKEVNLVTEGEDTEIDRNMVDVINDPLVHLVRNAVDHGIEFPEYRKKSGKPSAGTLKLSAYHSAGNVVVEISDDGKGLDKAAILERAKEIGYFSQDVGEKKEELNDREIYNLIFEPGFTTAKKVSDVSGRGVGLDVVKKNIENLRGGIEIQSASGRGSVFKLSLPLTLAIIDGMVVRVGEEKYVIPTVSIVRSIKPVESDLATVLRKGEMLHLQGKLIPIFRISELFEIQNARTNLLDALVVVVENDGRQAGLLIDELIGSQQIVIKTLGEMMSNIPGVSGSAIMPNGRVGLILDVGGLVRLANDQTGEEEKI